MFVSYRKITEELYFEEISKVLYLTTLRGDVPNHFLSFLRSKFGYDETERLRALYKIGSIVPHRNWGGNGLGATIFWEIDYTGTVRAGKIMRYNANTGHRDKDKIPAVDWVHHYYKLDNTHIKQCFFGEHLLVGVQNVEPLQSQSICIVESEKTAIICSHFFPQYTWLATGGKSSLKNRNFEPLLGKGKVVLYPDTDAFTLWNELVPQIKASYPDLDIRCSSLLQRRASEQEIMQNFDLADYLFAHPLPAAKQN
jgi:hypothetical protein